MKLDIADKYIIHDLITKYKIALMQKQTYIPLLKQFQNRQPAAKYPSHLSYIPLSPRQHILGFLHARNRTSQAKAELPSADPLAYPIKSFARRDLAPP